MKIEPYFKNPMHPITVNVIGVGGTGSLVIPRLARMDFALKKMGHPGLMVFAYDADKVEENNVGRQNFVDCDLNRNKALTIIEKCNLGFGLLWKAKQKMYVPSTSNSANVNIICVDNAQFRVSYYEWLEEEKEKIRYVFKKPHYVIDAGNGKDFGQVIFYSPYDEKSKSLIDLFPDISSQDTEELQGIAGCGYRDSLEKQDLFINDEMALAICRFLWKVFRSTSINQNGVMINQEKMKQLPIKYLE